jgi:uncharacterized membrane protein
MNTDTVPPTRDTEGRKETNRIEAFSDGVFAIAITLLILEIKVPQERESNAELMQALAGLGPSYFAFLTSFATVGIMWINHHSLFTLIRRSDHGLLLANTLLLLGVTFVPFPTSVLAEYLLAPAGQAAAIFYSGSFFFIAIFFNVLWRYASGGSRLLGEHTDRAAVRRISSQYAFAPLFYLVALALAFVSPVLSLAVNLLLALSFALPGPNPNLLRSKR